MLNTPGYNKSHKITWSRHNQWQNRESSSRDKLPPLPLDSSAPAYGFKAICNSMLLRIAILLAIDKFSVTTPEVPGKVKQWCKLAQDALNSIIDKCKQSQALPSSKGVLAQAWTISDEPTQAHCATLHSTSPFTSKEYMRCRWKNVPPPVKYPQNPKNYPLVALPHAEGKIYMFPLRWGE